MEAKKTRRRGSSEAISGRPISQEERKTHKFSSSVSLGIYRSFTNQSEFMLASSISRFASSTVYSPKLCRQRRSKRDFAIQTGFIHCKCVYLFVFMYLFIGILARFTIP